MTCFSDLFGTNEPTFLAFAPNFHTHPTPEKKVGFQVSGGNPSSRNLGYWISGVHPNLYIKVGYRVSGVPRVQGPGWEMGDNIFPAKNVETRSQIEIRSTGRLACKRGVGSVLVLRFQVEGMQRASPLHPS
jgi:hypothetical protein